MAVALERGDVAAAGACYADDAQLLTPAAGLIEGRQAIAEYWGTGIALGLSSVSFEAWRVERLGARQVEIGRYRVAVETEPTGGSLSYRTLYDNAADSGPISLALSEVVPLSVLL